MVAPGYHSYTKILREHTPDLECKVDHCTIHIVECTGWKAKIADTTLTLKTSDTLKILNTCDFIKGTGSLVLEITEHKLDK